MYENLTILNTEGPRYFGNAHRNTQQVSCCPSWSVAGSAK